MEDSELVSRALQRDQQAFAALYDRYADRLYDYARRQTGSTADAGDIVQDTFVLAIQRLHQLRDPSLVRPWLYAIARSEVHRRHRRVNRLQFTEPDEQAAMIADGPSAADLVHQQELRALFTEAANGLDPADREVLDLHLRHSLSGAEIAAALGIPERQVSVTVQRVRERLARSIGVVLLARNPACGELAELQRTEGSPLTVLSRKRLARHIDGCATCAQQLHDRMRPETLLAALPIALAPAAWRAEVLQRMAVAGGSALGEGGTRRPLRRRENSRVWQHADGFPRPATSLRLLAAVAVGVIASLLLVGVVVVSGGDSAKRVTAGAGTTLGEAAKPSNGTGPKDTTEMVDVTITGSTSTSTTAPATTSTATTLVPTTLPASTVAPTVSATAPATVPPTVQPTPPTTIPPDTSPPVFQSASASPTAVTTMHPDGSPMCSPDVEALTTTLTVSVTDDRGVTAVSVHFASTGVSGDRSLSKNGSVWQVTIGPFPEAAVSPSGSYPISATFTAVDAAGNSKALANGSIATLVDCPIVN